MTLRIALLGPPEVEMDGRPLVVDTRKAIAVLRASIEERKKLGDELGVGTDLTRPTPGIPKICSITIEPVSRAAAAGPT